MSESEIHAATTFVQTKQQIESLNLNITAAEDALDRIIRAAEAVRDETVQALARTARASFAETKRLVDAAGEECQRLEDLGLRITEEPGPEVKSAGVPRQTSQESSVKLSQIMSQYINRLINEDRSHLLELLRNLSELLPPSSPKSVIKELGREASATGVSMSSLDTLSGVEFEDLVTRLLARMGFRAETTKASGDGGVDVVATLDQPLTGGRYLIQCKRYAPDSTVGAAMVREFYGALTADRLAIKGILITTSAFTAQATEFTEGLPIELIARDKLQELLERHGLLHAAIPSLHPLARLDSAYGSILETLANFFPANSALVELRSAWQSMIQTVLNFLRTSLSADVASGETSQPKDRAAVLLDSAIRMHKQENNADAIKLLREAARLQSDNPDVWLWLGICYNSVGLHDDQIAALREAVRLRPDYEAWYWLGEGLHKVGDLDPAIDALTRANAISPDNVYTWLELGRTYRDKGTNEGALSAFNKAVTIKPDFVPAWFDLGLLHHEQRQYREALSAFLEAVRVNPDHAPSWKMLVLGYFWIGDYTRMEQAINRLERLDPATAREYRRNFLKK